MWSWNKVRGDWVIGKMGVFSLDFLVLLILTLTAICCIVLALFYARLMLNHSDAVVNWHKKEVESQDRHRERLERRFEVVEAELKSLAESKVRGNKGNH